MNKLKILIICLSCLFSQICLGQSNNKVDTSFYTKQSNVSFTIKTGETIDISKTKSNYIIDKFPELYCYPPQCPDKTYVTSPIFNDSTFQIDEQLRYYQSEGGQDTYFIFYAYFLKLKNGEQKFAVERNKLVEISFLINQIACFFNGGGTFYKHFRYRILADIEFEIFKLSQNDSLFNVVGDFVNEKKMLFDAYKKHILDCESIEIDSIEKLVFKDKSINLKSLKKEIKGNKNEIDEYLNNEITYGHGLNDSIDIEINTYGKIEVYKKRVLLEKLKLLDELITNYYYLKWAQSLSKTL